MAFAWHQIGKDLHDLVAISKPFKHPVNEDDAFAIVQIAGERANQRRSKRRQLRIGEMYSCS